MLSNLKITLAEARSEGKSPVKEGNKPIPTNLELFTPTYLLALILLVPAASIGIVTSLYIAPGILGQTLSVLCQVWLLVFPIAWSLAVDRDPLRFSLPKRRELLAGFIWGIFMFAAILGIYSIFGQQSIDPVVAKEKAQQLGISSPNIYLLVEAYFVLVNSLIE